MKSGVKGIIYLGGPMDSVPRFNALGWRSDAVERLLGMGFATFNPVAAFRGGDKSIGRRVDEINRMAIINSDAILARIDKGQETVGTFREIEFARAQSKPVILLAPHLEHHLCTWDLHTVPTMEAAMELIARAIKRGIPVEMVEGTLLQSFVGAPVSSRNQ